jgi:hypothetical protein
MGEHSVHIKSFDALFATVFSYICTIGCHERNNMVVVQNIKLANRHRQCQVGDGENGKA